MSEKSWLTYQVAIGTCQKAGAFPMTWPNIDFTYKVGLKEQTLMLL